MKGRSTFVLLGAILVLGSFFGLQQFWFAKVPSREVRRVTLFKLDVDRLDSLEFQYTNLVVECRKENGVWMTGSPGQGQGRADIALVHGMVWGLNRLGKGTTITEKQLKIRGFDDSEYGFSPCSLRIVAVDNRGTHVWLVGRDGTLGDMLYVKEGDGEDIFTISKTLREIAPTEADQLRDRVAFSVDFAGIRQLEIRGPGGLLQLMKGTKGDWQIQQPLVAEADEVEVGAFLKKLQALRIDDFVVGNASDSVYGLQGEMQQISLGGADGASSMLVFGDVIPDRPDFVYARRADDTSVFALKKGVMDLLAVDRDYFRNRRVLPLDARAIDSISIIHGTEQLDLLETEPGRWAIAAPVSWEADLWAVDALLVEWNDSVIIEFDDVSNDTVPEWEYVFGSSSLGQTNTIHVLPTHGRKDGLRIRRDDEATVYQLNLRKISDSATDPLAFKNKLLWQLEVGDIQKVSIEGRTGKYAVERQEDGTFVSSGTNGMLQVDSAALGGVLDGLKTLNASSYVTYDPCELSAYGLDKPSLSMHLGLVGTNQLGRVLLIGEETKGGSYAMVQGRDVVFLLEKKAVDVFSQNLLVEQENAVPETE